MLKTIIKTSVTLRLPVIIIAVTLVVLGIFQLRDTAVEAFPDFGPVRVEVQTEALGLSPEEVENLITNPMEQEFFNGIPWLHKIRSKSLPGLSSIEMIFEPGTNPIQARQVVQERLTMVPALPQVSKAPFVIQPVATTSRLMMIALSSDTISLIDLSVLARWRIKQHLLGVPGVANISIWGFRDRQLQVLVDPERLNKEEVKLVNILHTAGNAMWSSPLTFVEASTPGTGGFIDTTSQRIEIQHLQPIKTANELAKVTVEGYEDRALTLGEIASVVEGHQLLIGDAVVNDKPGVLMVIERFPDTSIMEVTRSVEKALDVMRPGLPGIEIDTSVYRAASYVELGRYNIASGLLTGIILLMVFLLVIYLPNWRKALISILTIVVSLFAGWYVLQATGARLNMMVIAGLVMAFVIIIDDGIVYINNIGKRIKEQHSSGGNATRAHSILTGTLGMAVPLLTTILLIIVSVVPVFVLGEVSGAFLKAQLQSYAMAAIVSMLVAIIVTPGVAALFMSSEKYHGGNSPIIDALGKGYIRLLEGIVKKPAAMIVPAVILIGVCAGLLPLLGNLSLIPQLKDHTLLVNLRAVPGTSLVKMSNLTLAASKDLRSLPGIKNVGGHIGRAMTSDKLINVDTAELWVSIDKNVNYNNTVSAVEKMFAQNYADLAASVTTYPNYRHNEVTAELGSNLVVRVYGRFYDILENKASEVIEKISGVKGVVQPRVQMPVFEPTVEIEVRIPDAAAQGVKPGDVRRAAATMVAGITAGNLFEEQKIFDVVVWGEANIRKTLKDIKGMLIDTPGGELVRMDEVADVRLKPNPSIIDHDAVSRYVDIVASVEGRSLASVSREVDSILSEMTFPIEHHVEVMGDSVERETTMNILIGYIIAAIIAIFFLLHARFTSWKLPILLLLLIPMGLAGAVVAAILLPGTPPVLALVGGLSVFIILMRGSILQITGYQRLEHEEGKEFGPGLILEGSGERFGPILVSTIAIILVVVPLLILGGTSGLELMAPIGAIILGGLITVTLLNLFILPALYMQFGANTKPERLDFKDVKTQELQ